MVHPRTEALLAWPTTLPITAQSRLSLGIPQLDEMLRGGILARSTTMLVGATGSGKTLLGLHFLATGALENQAGLYFGFYEPPAHLISLADQVGLDFSGRTSSGLIEILWHPPVESDLDSLAGRLLQAVRHRQVQCLFIDKLDGFVQVATYPERLSHCFTALLNELRALGVTTLFSVQTPNLFGPPI